MRTAYYISWHPSIGCINTKCFSTAEEREKFRQRVENRHAAVQTWESEVQTWEEE